MNLKTLPMLLVVKHRLAQEPVHLRDLAAQHQDGCPFVRLAGHRTLTAVLRQHHMLRLSPLMACRLELLMVIKPLPITHHTFLPSTLLA
jgi:hypothetical protein